MFIYAVVLILMMLFRPSGLLGTKEFSLTNLISRTKPSRKKGGAVNE
jgi:branched-chain amino acid ABC superfamily ATP binding cassette transporter, permease protein